MEIVVISNHAGPRQVEVSRRIVSLVDKRSNNVSKLRADKEGTSSSHQRDRSLLRKAKEGETFSAHWRQKIPHFLSQYVYYLWK